MIRAVAPLAALAIAACAPGLKHHSTRNAPGLVDLDLAYAPERGDPDAYEEPADPGEHQLGIAPAAWFMPGVGRIDPGGDATLEAGLQVQVSYGQRSWSGGKHGMGFPWDAWGLTLGWAVVQTTPDVTDSTTFGPLHLELSRHWLAFGVAAGLAVYPTPGTTAGGRAEGVDAGGQVSLWAGPLTVRMRYIQDSGFEVFGGYQLYLPYGVTWSR